MSFNRSVTMSLFPALKKRNIASQNSHMHIEGKMAITSKTFAVEQIKWKFNLIDAGNSFLSLFRMV